MTPVFIYTLNDPQTGVARYCGQTMNPGIRLSQHISVAPKEKWRCANWIKSLLSKKLRPVMEILDVVPDTEADFWEREYIQNFRERGFDLTNLTDGGEAPFRGKKHSPEAIEKMRQASLGNKNHLGKNHSPEACAKMSSAAIKRVGEKNSFFGKKHTAEARIKMGIAMSIARLGKKRGPYKKKSAP